MESYRTIGNIIEVCKQSKQRKINVHDRSRTILHRHKQEIIDDKGSDREHNMGRLQNRNKHNVRVINYDLNGIFIKLYHLEEALQGIIRLVLSKSQFELAIQS